MLRFIIKHAVKDGYSGITDSGFETVDIDVPELEAILASGGFSEGSYDYRTLVGVEMITPTKPEPIAEQPAHDTGWHSRFKL